jgi:hypothetical protein
VEIPPTGWRVRKLGIPTVLIGCADRLIQQAVSRRPGRCLDLDQELQSMLPLQCLMSHMTQLPTMVPPTNRAKQKAPKRIIIRGSARCVIPKTIEVKREKRSTAPK